jgi:hypothetical protein
VLATRLGWPGIEIKVGEKVLGKISTISDIKYLGDVGDEKFFRFFSGRIYDFKFVTKITECVRK